MTPLVEAAMQPLIAQGANLAAVKRIAQGAKVSTKSEDFIKQGFRVAYPQDGIYAHLHCGLHTARSIIEGLVFNYIQPDEVLFEIASSARTIRMNYRNLWLNRPVIAGFNGDREKQNMIMANPQQTENLTWCGCLQGADVEQQVCQHVGNKTIFTVDTLYYLWSTLIRKFADDNRRQLHVLHMPKKSGKAILLPESATEQEGICVLKGNSFTMETRGNENTYEHLMFVTAEKPYIEVDGGYINFIPLETFDTGATIYGLFELMKSTVPQPPVGKRLVSFSTYTGVVAEEKEVEKIGLDQAIQLEFADIEKKEGLYKIMLNGNPKYIRVCKKGSFTMLSIDENKHETWVAISQEKINASVKKISLLTNAYEGRPVEELVTMIKKVIIQEGTISNTNTDLMAEFATEAMKRSERVLKAVDRIVTSENTKLLKVDTDLGLVWQHFFFLYMLLDVIMLYKTGYSSMIAYIMFILRFVFNNSIETHLGIMAVCFIIKQCVSMNTARVFVRDATDKVTKNYNHKLIYGVALIMLVGLCICATERNRFQEKLVLDNCTENGYIIGLEMSPYRTYTQAEIKKEIRNARAAFHPDKSDITTDESAALNNCLDKYAICAGETTCSANINLRVLFVRLPFFLFIVVCYLILVAMLIVSDVVFTREIFINGFLIDFLLQLLFNPIALGCLFMVAGYNGGNDTVLTLWYIWVVISSILTIIYNATIAKYLSIICLMVVKILKKILVNKYMATTIIAASVVLGAKSVYAKTNSKGLLLIESVCCKYPGGKEELDNNVKWNILTSKGVKHTFKTGGECNCPSGDVPTKKMYKIVEDIDDIEPPKIYHACWSNNISSLSRMAIAMPTYDPKILNEFKNWFEVVLQNEIIPALDNNLIICEKAWFNHLTAKKQNEIKEFIAPADGLIKDLCKDDLREMNTYTNFVKPEKQVGENPKTRCICSPGSKYKYCMGPVTYALEQVFKKFYKGYKVPLTWGAQEEALDEYSFRGLTSTLQLDGKGFDLTQLYEIKQIVDHRIYALVKDKVEHVDPELFMEVACAENRTIKPTCVVNGKIESYGTMNVRGKVFSGSMDTTLMNTIRMACYVRFSADRANINDYEVWVKGDDTVFFISPADLEILLKSINELFCTEKEWTNEPTIAKGLGQIAKFIKVGYIVDFDFCSTMAIETKAGFKITRKMDNILHKEHFSVKIGIMDMDSYNNDLLTSAMCWINNKDTMLAKYYRLVHPYTKGAKPILKTGGAKMYLDSAVKYENAYVDYDYKIQEERQSNRSFTDDEMMESLLAMADDTQLIAYMSLVDRLSLVSC